MITDPTRVCELLVGLPDVVVLGVEEDDELLEVHVEQCWRPACRRCGTAAWVKDRPIRTLVDLSSFGRRTRLVWHQHRWRCPNRSCPVGSWTGEDNRIAAPRQSMTDRAGRWVTRQVGRHGRAVSDVADDLGCHWHTVNDAVIAYGTALVDDDPDRIGNPTAVGLDETMFKHVGRFREQCWSTQIVDVEHGILLDVVAGRDGAEPCRWFEARGETWCEQVRWATLDLSASYRAVFNTMLPDARQVADPFHVVRVANTAMEECRRRVQQETLGHRGHKNDPLYRARRRLVLAAETLTEAGREKLRGLLRAGDPTDQVWFAWNANKRSSARSTTSATQSWPASG